MSAELESHLELSIWREYVPKFRLASSPLEDFDNPDFEIQPNVLVSDNNSNLSKAIYTITIREDVLAGIVNEDHRKELKDLLFGLKISDPPFSRSLQTLKELVLKANKILESNESAVSHISNQPDSVEENPVEFNALLALKLHLDWILRCFADCPKVTVTTR